MGSPSLCFSSDPGEAGRGNFRSCSGMYRDRRHPLDRAVETSQDGLLEVADSDLRHLVRISHVGVLGAWRR